MNDLETDLQTARAVLADWAGTFTEPEPNRLDVVVPPADLLRAAAALDNAGWGYLSAITGLDHGAEAGQMEVLYHFCEGAAVVTLRVPVPRDEPAVPSLCARLPAAGLFERELAEMFGVTVTGAPDPSRLYLPDDWPEGVYPLRKDAAVAET